MMVLSVDFVLEEICFPRLVPIWVIDFGLLLDQLKWRMKRGSAKRQENWF
jgi:hypothetical protein